MSIPQFLYFDLGRVILEFERSVAYRQLAEVAGVSSERVQEILENEKLQLRYEAGEFTSREYYERFCHEVDGRPDYARLLEAGNSMFYPNVPILSVITQLAAANYSLGVLSNTCEAHWEYCTGRFGILRTAFDTHVLSYRVKALKPDATIYAAAAKAAGCDARDIFFVDDIAENVEGARRFGIDAVQYVSVPRLVEDLKSRGVRFNY